MGTLNNKKIINGKESCVFIKKIDDKEVLELYHQGFLHREIADKLGCATCTITQHLLKMGIKSYDMNRRQQVLELYNQGLYDKEIAEKLGVCREDVTHLLNAQGITSRRGKIDDIDLRNRISNSLIGRYYGENNPNFQGCENEYQMARGIFKTISKRLIRNSNHTCVCCHKTSENLEVHHIKPFKLIMNEFLSTVYDGNINTIYNQLTNYPDFMDESNLVVVCQDCHKLIHYSDNHELNPFRWGSATTIEKVS